MSGAGGLERRIAFVCRPVGTFDGAQAGGDAGFAVGDGLAVASAVGAFGQVLAVELDFAEVGFAFVGVGGDGVDGDVRGGGVQDEGDGLALRVVAGQDGDQRSVGRPARPARSGGRCRAGSGRGRRRA